MKIDQKQRQSLMVPVEHLAMDAGRRILEIRGKGATVETKPDGSPVSDADLAADEMICRGLERLTPSIPIISEETWTEESDNQPDCYWCVDPLDGTRGFLNGGGDFTVNIALVSDKHPVLGVIMAPARQMIWLSDGHVAVKRYWEDASQPDPSPQQIITTRKTSPEKPVVITTMSKRNQLLQTWLDLLNPGAYLSVGSSLKFCVLAEGKADLYPRIGTTMEWDTAAGQAILEAAGGTMIDDTGKRFSYGKARRRNAQFTAMGSWDHPVPANWLPPTDLSLTPKGSGK